MKRRDFFKQSSLAAGMVSLPLISPQALAAGVSPDQFFVYYHCRGGWDSTSFIDPKGDQARNDSRGFDSRVNRFADSQILKQGNIRYAPLYIDGAFVDDPKLGCEDPEGLLDNQQFSLQTLNNSLDGDADIRASAQAGLFNAFFTRYHNKLCVINGINHQTNSHQTGMRFASSGSNREGYPNFSALYAADYADAIPMAYITDGQGYNSTGDLVAESRLDSINNLNYLVDANKINADYRFYNDDIWQQITDAQRQRQQLLLEQTNLPAKRRRLLMTQSSQAGAELEQLMQAFMVDGSTQVAGLSNLQRQMSIAANSFAKGLAASCHIASNSGFDTHTNNMSRKVYNCANYAVIFTTYGNN